MNLKALVEEFRKRQAAVCADGSTLPSRKLFARIKHRHFRELLAATEGERPLIWSAATLPTELTVALDLAVLSPETYATQAVLASADGLDYIDQGVANGASARLCKAYLAAEGMALAGELPAPKAIVGSTLPCDSSTALYHFLMEQYPCPSFRFHIPYLEKAEEPGSPAQVYLEAQLRGQMEFLEDLTGRKTDPDCLARVCGHSVRAYNHLVRIEQELRQGRPCALSGRQASYLQSAYYLHRGRPETEEYYRELHREITARSPDGQEREAHRLGWLGIFPFYDPGLLTWLEKEHRAEVVMDFGNLLPERELDPEAEPLSLIAHRELNSPGWRVCWPYQTWRRDFLDQARAFNLDAFVVYNQVGCTNMGGLAGLIKADLRDELGIPTLIMDGDPLDPRVVPMANQKRRLDDFMNILLG